MSVLQWLASVDRTLRSNDVIQASQDLAELFIMNVSFDQVAIIQNDLWQQRIDVDTYVDQYNLFDSEWPAFNELAKAYLRFCKEVNPFDLRESYDLFAVVLQSLQVAFLNSRGPVLTVTLVNTTNLLIPMALNFDIEDVTFRGQNGRTMYRLTHVAAATLKSFNTIRGERVDSRVLNEIKSKSPDAKGAYHGTKKSILIYVACTLCRLYSYLDQLTSCSNVFANVQGANIRFNIYPMSQRVEYRFWLGRYYLLKNQLCNAYCHLYWSFAFCNRESFNNQRTILIYLIPASMLLGKFPTRKLLMRFNLYDIYWPLVEAMKRPDFTAFKAHLRIHRPWFLSRSLYMLLDDKSTIIMLHRLIRTLWKACNQQDTMTFQAIQTALVWANYPLVLGSDAELLAENVCISLISQGLVKGHIFTRSKIIKLRSHDALANPPEFHRIDRLAPARPTGNDAWMG